jgi:hypothetical protein
MDKLIIYVPNKLDQTIVLRDIVVCGHYFNWPMSFVISRRNSNALVSRRRVGYVVYDTRADKKWQTTLVTQNTAPVFKSDCIFIGYSKDGSY